MSRPSSMDSGGSFWEDPAEEPDRGHIVHICGQDFLFPSMGVGWVYREPTELLTPMEAARTHGKSMLGRFLCVALGKLLLLSEPRSLRL